ncbi:hypothetical protein D3C79_986580 [compost metagenome]
MPGADNGNQDHVSQQATEKTQRNQRRQHRPLQGFGTAGDQRGEGGHRHRIRLGIGQTENDAVPERFAHRPLFTACITRTTAQCTQAEPEQVQATEQTENIEY